MTGESLAQLDLGNLEMLAALPSRLTVSLALGLTSIFCLADGVSAHPISLSAAVVDIRPQKVRVDVTIMLEDLVLYYRLRADGNQRFATNDLRTASQKHRAFLTKNFIIRDAAGRPLKSRVVDVDGKRIGDKGVPQSELMSKTVEYRMEFELPGKPKFLTIMQSFGGSSVTLPAIMDCMVLQNGVLLKVSEQLASRQPMSIEIDWQNPPKSGRNWRELKAKREEQRRKRLGISSFSGLYSFIYITNNEVRHEILIPLLTFEKWLPIARKDVNFISVDEQTAATNKIAALFRAQADIEIDGRRVLPALQRLDFFGLDIRDFALNAKPRRMSVHQARLGVILTYAAPRPPNQVNIRWKLFDKHAAFLKSAILVHDQKARSHTFVKDRPVFSWQAKHQPKLLEVKPVARDAKQQMSATSAAKICGQLVNNVYAAFQYRDEGRTYDALATSTSGDVLRKIYLQIRKALLMTEQGGARSRVTEIKITSGKLLPAVTANQFRYDCRWRVKGTIEHWGHVHQRENEYHATLTIKAIRETWRIVGYEVHQLRRIGFQTTLR